MTTNKNLNTPASNTPSWDGPLNTNFNEIDNAFGGTQQIVLTGSSGTITLSATSSPSYVPLILSLSGVPTGAVNIQFPSGVGGEWVVINACTGTYSSLTFSNAAGGATTVVPAGQIRSIVSVNNPTGYGVIFADSQTTVAGSDTQVIINESGTLTGTSGLTYSYSAGTPTLTANALAVTTNAAITGNQTVGGTVTATGTIKSNTSFTFPDSTVQTTAYTSPIPTMVVFTSSGSWTVPSGVTKIRLHVVGGGGAGGSSYAGGGGGGGAAIKTISGLTAGQVFTIAVGAGGTGTVGGAGNSGGNSSVTSSSPVTSIVASGGAGGGTSTNIYSGGAGGSATGGDLNLSGSGGTGGGSNAYVAIVGGGGASALGTGGGWGGWSSGNGATGGNYGGGGSASGAAGGAGNAGGGGVVFIEY